MPNYSNRLSSIVSYEIELPAVQFNDASLEGLYSQLDELSDFRGGGFLSVSFGGLFRRLRNYIQGEVDKKIKELEQERSNILNGSESYFGSTFQGTATAIDVEFDTNRVYTYPALRHGQSVVDHMIRLAEQQSGLCSYIQLNLR